MTIRTRNRLFLFLFIVSLLSCAATSTLFIIAAIKGNLSTPDQVVRPFVFFGSIIRYQPAATLAGIIAFAVYVPVVMAFLYFGFEKTQSQEVIYFAAYLIGCMCEGSRLLMPISGIWRTTSMLLIMVGRVVIAGRILVLLSMLFATLFSSLEQRQFVERNIAILLTLSSVIAMFYPIDTMYTTSTFIVQYGYSTLFKTMQIMLFMATALTLIIQALLNPSSEQTHMCLGYLIMMTGYSLLTHTDNFIYLGTALALLPLGSFLYLRGVHSQYLWH